MPNIFLLTLALKGRILQDLAEEAGVTYGCLYNIREGKTQWPRKKTLEKLLPLVGLKMELVYES